MDNKNLPLTGKTDDKDNCQMKNELLEVIEQYLNEKRKRIEYDEVIEADVYYLLGKSDFELNISLYLFASVSALRAFTSKDVSDSLKQEMGTPRFNDLCIMLERMVQFCWNIKSNEMSLAQLDQLMWRSNQFSCSVDYIRNTKNKYEHLLENIKAKVSRA